MQATATTHDVLPRQVSTTPALTVPLTTITTYPASCSNALWSYFTNGTLPLYFKTYWPSTSVCNPPGWTGAIAVAGSMKLYSPGVCPSGWVIASQTSDDSLGATTAYCCPSGIPIASRDWGDSTKVCSTVVTTPTSATSGDVTVITSFFTGLLWAVSIAWAESDLDSFTPRSAPLLARFDASATSNTAATPTATSSITTAQPTTIQNSYGGLSTGAQAGIGVGVAIVVLATLAVFFFFYRRRKHSKVPEISKSEQSRNFARPSYKDGNGGKSGTGVQNLDYHEMSPETDPLELSGSDKFAYQPYRSPT